VVGEHENFVTPGELAEFDLRVVAGAGHLVNLERTDAFNEILLEFLARV
jgi:pimeloyl-ACP methyl ester carboxylesterase